MSALWLNGKQERALTSVVTIPHQRFTDCYSEDAGCRLPNAITRFRPQKSPKARTSGLICLAALFAFAPSIHKMYYFHFALASYLGQFT